MNNSDRIGFFDAFLGLVVDPFNTINRLYRQSVPPHMFLFFAALILTIFGPLFYQVYRLDFADTKMNVVIAFGMALVIATFVFVGVETLLLRLLGVEIGFDDVVAGVAYSTAPLTVLLIGYLIADYSMTGELNLVNYVLTGYAHFSDKFLLIFPWIHLVGKILVIVIFFNVMRVAGAMNFLTASMVTVLSLGVFYSALVLGLKFSERFFPNTLDGFLLLLFQMVKIA